MAKKVKSMIKLQVPAAKATPAPPIGPALGQHGVNIPGFCKEFNERTQKDAGMIIPVVSYIQPLLGKKTSLYSNVLSHCQNQAYTYGSDS